MGQLGVVPLFFLAVAANGRGNTGRVGNHLLGHLGRRLRGRLFRGVHVQLGSRRGAALDGHSVSGKPLHREDHEEDACQDSLKVALSHVDSVVNLCVG